MIIYTYPRLYNNVLLKYATMKELKLWNNHSWIWNITWHVEWFKWEANQVSFLLQMKTHLIG